MTLIRFRLFLINLVSFALVAGFGLLTFSSYRQQTRLMEELTLSYVVEDQAKAIENLKFDRTTMTDLQHLRARLNPPHRMEALSGVIQAYADRNPYLYKTRLKVLLANEKEYRKYLAPILDYLQTRVYYYALLTLVTMLMGILSSWIYLNNSLFSPLKVLSRRMLDFLHHRYTYQFTQPAPNEVGHLQSTFNSMAQRVLQNMEDLTALDRAKSEFLSIASHELRTPLTSIKGSLSLLRSGIVGKLNEAALNLMNIAETETDRLIRLINDLLDLAKIEAGKFPLHPSWQPLIPLLQSNTQSLQGLAAAAQVQLSFNCEMNIETHMDKDRIQQVLTNLISNAVKFSPQGGLVEVICSIDPQQNLLIEVQDQGRGIAPQDQELIFQKFRQATSPENPLVKGTGLGLAIAKALVEEHGGTIGVRSTIGQGSTFYFTLPKWRLILEKASELEVRAA